MNVLLSSSGWILGIVATLNAVACEPVDHLVGGEETGTGNGNTGGDSDLPVLDSCDILRDDSDEGSCRIEAECGDARVSSSCVSDDDALECDCADTGLSVTFRLTGVKPANGCSHALAACLTWPELEAEPYACTPTTEVDDPGFCLLDADCTRKGVIGDAQFTEFHHRQSDCAERDDGTGWACGCGSPNGGIWHIETPTNEFQCADGFRWCVGEDVERSGSQTCTPVYEEADGDTCVTELECWEPGTVSGQAATMLEYDIVACRLGDDGLYECQCDWVGAYDTPVAAEDLQAACNIGVSACAN